MIFAMLSGISIAVKKCITPKGDENVKLPIESAFIVALRNVLPRKGTRTDSQLEIAEVRELRNVLPRKGTRTTTNSQQSWRR